MRLVRHWFPSLSHLAAPLILLACPIAAQAQQPAPLRFAEQILVTPTRSEGALDRVPAHVVVLDADDITASAALDIPDLLRQSGAHVVDVTGNRRSYRVDLRGFGATAGLNTLVLVDGRRVNQPDLSGTDWAQIPLDRVARIEIVPGSGGAVLYGDSASGGVINIITKAGGPQQMDASLLAGSYGTWTPAFSTGGSSGRLTYSVSGRYTTSEGHRENAATEGVDAGGQVAVALGARADLTISGGYHGDETGLPGALRTSELAAGVARDESTHPDDFADVDDGYVMITPRLRFGDASHALVDVSFRQRDSHFFSSSAFGSFTADTGLGTVAVSPKVVFAQPMGSGVHNLVAGADLAAADEDVAFSGFTDVFKLKKTSAGLYVNDEWRAGATTVTGGYRYEAASYEFAPSDPADRDFDEHAANGGVTVNVASGAAVFGRISRAFRMPVLDEMFDFFGRTITLDLVPQRSLDVAGGVRVERGTTRASVSVFRLLTDEEIYYNPVGGFGFGANENLDGTSRRTGIELAASTLAEGVEVGGTYVFTATSIDGGAYDGQEMPGVPRHRFTVYGRLPLPSSLTLGVETRFVGERPFEGDFTAAYGAQDAYFVADARLAYRRSGLRVFLDLKNLFDEQYAEYGVLAAFPEETAFYPSPGFHALVGVEVGF
jgi:iron complex outermembrane receptor protein